MMIADIYCAARRLTQVLTLAAVAVFAVPAMAANYPLELVSPRAANTAPVSGKPAISAANRIFWAYPGLEYNVRAAVIGGAYPYSFELANAPAGMTVNSNTGEISWPNPTASASPTLRVTDSEGSSVQGSWTINVDANRFIFIDANRGRDFDAGTPGTGTISNPFRRIRDLYSGNTYAAKTDGRHVNKIAYFRSGTYYIDGFVEDTNGNYAGRMAVLDTAKPVAWIAYPGESPVIDGQCRALSPQIGSRPCNYGTHIAFYGNGNNTYIDGFRFVNFAVHAFRTAGTGNYQVFRRSQYSINGPTVGGVNQGFITTMAGENGAHGNYLTIQDNVFQDIEQGSCIKLYSTQRVLIEDNICRDVQGGESEALAAKGGEMDRVTIRRNTITDFARSGIGGNMHVLLSGEILFNFVSGNSTRGSLDVNQDGVAGRMYIERNTFVGRVAVNNTDSADGPFYFRNNVIVNSDPGNHLYFGNVTDPSRVVLTDNLVGTPAQGIVDSAGLLTAAYEQFRGIRGHEIGNSSRPLPPTALRAE